MINLDALVLGPCFDTWAEPVTFIPAAGGTMTSLYGPNAGRGVFDDGFSTVFPPGSDIPTATERPVLGVRISDFITPPDENDKVYIPKVNATYIVRNRRPDSHGHSLLELQFVSSP